MQSELHYLESHKIDNGDEVTRKKNIITEMVQESRI